MHKKSYKYITTEESNSREISCYYFFLVVKGVLKLPYNVRTHTGLNKNKGVEQFGPVQNGDRHA